MYTPFPVILVENKLNFDYFFLKNEPIYRLSTSRPIGLNELIDWFRTVDWLSQQNKFTIYIMIFF